MGENEEIATTINDFIAENYRKLSPSQINLIENSLSGIIRRLRFFLTIAHPSRSLPAEHLQT